MARHIWTPAQVAALVEAYPDYPTEILAQALGVTLRAAYAKAAGLGLKKSEAFLASDAACRLRRGDNVGAASRFSPGHQTWNKGMKGLCFEGSKATQFPPGHRGGRAAEIYQPIGAERISKDGYLQRKINDDLPLQKRWRAVHLIVWEAENGPVPPGHAVVFRDGDKTHIALANLECITRCELMARNTIHRLPPEIKEVIIIKRSITRLIHQKEKAHGRHD